MKKRLLSIMTALALCLSLLPTVALAAAPVTDVPYYDWNSDTKQLESKACASATEVTSGGTGWGTSETTTWYVVTGNVEIGSRVTVSGNVHLILADGCTLAVNGGIQVEDLNALTIYSQSTNESTMGKLSANAVDGHAGIGGGVGIGSGGTITINEIGRASCRERV